MKNVQGNNHLPATETLAFGPEEVIGERTPCLEGSPEALYPALTAHHMTYDSSFTRRGISWPTHSHQYKIWQLGMAEFPVHGTSHFQVTMDYNFYFTQRGGSSAGVTPAQSAQDSTQVQATYQDMYNATTAGNRAPLILGNHFNEWNNSAYSQALGKFLLANCAKPDTHCVSFRDLIGWMNIQDPAVLTHLQQQAPENGAPGSMTATEHPTGRSGRAAASIHPGRASARTGRGRWPAAAARWLLLGAVIAGVLAMHILSAADSGGNHQPTAMTPAGGGSPAMSMGMPMPGVDLAPSAYPVAATELSGGLGAGMAPMTCCVLAFVSAAGLVLLMRPTKPAATPAADRFRGRAAPSAVLQRGPPGPGRPRIALSILRV